MSEDVKLKDATGFQLHNELRWRLATKSIGDPQYELFFALPSWCKEGILIEPSDLDLEVK